MKITVDGDVKEVKDGITISELIEQEKVETPEYVSVSVNEEFEQRANFDTRKLNSQNPLVSPRMTPAFSRSLRSWSFCTCTTAPIL